MTLPTDSFHVPIEVEKIMANHWKLRAVVSLTGLVAAMCAVGTTPASAGANCANGNHCVFWSNVNSSKHSYFNSDRDFWDDFFSGGNGAGNGERVFNNVWAASNSSTGGYESHYYTNTDYTGFLFCVNPGDTVYELPSHLKDAASSMRLRGTTSISCIGS